MKKIILGALLVLLLVVGVVFGFSAGKKPQALTKNTSTVSVSHPSEPAANLPLLKIDATSVSADRVFLVSDIHGRFDSLKKALSDVKFSKKDALYVLGDTIDRGPGGFHALLYLTQTLPTAGYQVHVLQGNHEDMWAAMAAQGANDAEQLSNLNGAIDIYEGSAPNGWAASQTEWNALSAAERAFLLSEMKTGFGNPRELIIHYGGKWLSLSHSANMAESLSDESAWDLAWNNRNMINAPATLRDSIAKRLSVNAYDVQIYIGHISNFMFGTHPNYTDLDDTPVQSTLEEFDATPVKLFNVRAQSFEN
ncbi:MAG: metallophosphoesterase [Streptococcaceae bacterium]|jgi:hypothetical protein|nr:metallophosphoesterase [Streptococcaceae bacterium]